MLWCPEILCAPTEIDYCPLINGSPIQYSTVYTVLKTAQKMVSSLGQKECVITFELAIYSKAKEIQWHSPVEFSDTIIRNGWLSHHPQLYVSTW